MRISGITVVSSIAIPETVSLSSFQFQVSHNTTARVDKHVLFGIVSIPESNHANAVFVPNRLCLSLFVGEGQNHPKQFFRKLHML